MRPIDPELKEKIRKEYKETGITYQGLVDKYKISIATICRICSPSASNGKTSTPKKSKTSKPKEDNMQKKLTFTKVTNEASNVEAVMINGRHEFPTLIKDYIFETFEQGQFFKFSQQEETVNKFIDSHFKFNEDGIPDKCLDVYVTGLQIALGTIVKVCVERKIPLNLKHYTSFSGKYVSQKVLDFDYQNRNSEKIQSLIKSYDQLCTVNCNINEIIDTDKEFYAVEIVHRELFGNNEIKAKELYLCKDLQTAYLAQNEKSKPYVEKFNEVMDTFEAYLQTVKNDITNGKNQWHRKTIQKSYINPVP